MADEIASIGIAVDTGDVSRAVRSLDELASRGAPTEKALKGVESAAKQAGQGVASLGQSAASAGMEKVGSAGERAAHGLGKMGQAAQSAVSSQAALARAVDGFTKVEHDYIKALSDEVRQMGMTRGERAAYIAQSRNMSQSAQEVARAVGDKIDAYKREQAALEGTQSVMAQAQRLAAGVFSGLSVAATVGKLVSVQREFDVLNSSLVTVAGSSAAAEREMAWLKTFAKETPFGLAQATQGFVKMKALGLDPTRAALTSFGNTASAMGKDLNQMIEAVADASTGEFERLKEFGIKASKEGDRVSLTFQGITTTIKNSASEITRYLEKIGNTQFAGAMEERAKTLDGSIAALGDSWDELFRTINSQNVGSLIFDSVTLASKVIDDATTIVQAFGRASDGAAKDTGALVAMQGGAATFFETVGVLAANTLYVLRQTGDTLGGLAAGYKAFFSFDFDAVRSIGAEMRANAEAARKEIDATTARILGARKEQEEYAKWATRNASAANDPRRLDRPAGAKTSDSPSKPDAKGLSDALNAQLQAYKSADKAILDERKSFYDQLGLMAKLGTQGEFDIIDASLAKEDEIWARRQANFQAEIAQASKKKNSAAEVARITGQMQDAERDYLQNTAKLRADAVLAEMKYADALDGRIAKQEAAARAAQLQVRTAQEEGKAIGLTGDALREHNEAIVDNKAKRLEALAVWASGIDLSGQLAKAYLDEAAALRTLSKEQGENRSKQLVYEYAKGIEDSNRLLQAEVDLMGLSTREREITLEQLRIQLDLEQKIAQIKSLEGDTPERAARIAKMQASAATAKANASSRVFLEDWKRSVQQYDDIFRQGFADMLNNGEAGWDSFTKSLATTFKTTVADQIYKAFLQPIVVNVVGNLMGVTGALGMLGGAGGGGNGGMLGLANNASTLNTGYQTLMGNSWVNSAWNTAAGWFGGGSAAAGGLTAGIGSGLSLYGGGAAGGLAATTGSGLALVGGTSGGLGITAGSAGAGSIGAGLGSSAAAGAAGGAGAGGALMAAAPYAAAVLAVAAAFGMFGGTEKRGGGVTGTLGRPGGIKSFDLMRDDGSLFSGPDYYTEFRGVAPQDQALQDAFAASKAHLSAFAQSLGLATDSLEGFTTGFGAESVHPDVGLRGLNLDGLSDAEAAKKIQEALQAADNAIAQQLIGRWETVTTQVAREWDGLEDIADWFADITSGAAYQRQVYTPSEYTREGEQAIDTLTRLATSLQAANAAFDMLGNTLYEASLAGADAASQLIDAFGGVEQMAQAAGVYFQNFYSAEEQREYVRASLQRALDGVQLQLPDIDAADAREQFRSLAEAQDRSTEAGRKAYAALLNVSGAFAQITQSAEEAARAAEEAARKAEAIARERAGLQGRLNQALGNTAALRARELAALDASNRALQQHIWAAEDARAAVDSAMSALERSVAARREVLEEAAGEMRAVFDAVRSGAKSLLGDVESLARHNLQSGADYIAQALAAAERTGYLPDAGELAEAIDGVQQGLTKEVYATQADADFQRLVVANRLKGLERISGDQLTETEKQLRALDGILDNARAQIDALYGIDSSVLSVEAAVRQLEAAILAALQAQLAAKPAASMGGAFNEQAYLAAKLADLNAGNNRPADYTGTTLQDLKSYIAQHGMTPAQHYLQYGQYEGLAGFGPVSTPSAGGAGAASSGGFDEQAYLAAKLADLNAGNGRPADYAAGSASQLKDYIAQHGMTPYEHYLLYGQYENLPKFAAGTNRVPRDMVAMIHEGEAIIPKAFNPWAGGQGGQGGNAELVSEVRALREDNRAQAGEIVRLHGQIARLLQRWDGEGLPAERLEVAA